jgi:hypothetical protein
VRRLRRLIVLALVSIALATGLILQVLFREQPAGMTPSGVFDLSLSQEQLAWLGLPRSSRSEGGFRAAEGDVPFANPSTYSLMLALHPDHRFELAMNGLLVYDFPEPSPPDESGLRPLVLLLHPVARKGIWERSSDRLLLRDIREDGSISDGHFEVRVFSDSILSLDHWVLGASTLVRRR